MTDLKAQLEGFSEAHASSLKRIRGVGMDAVTSTGKLAARYNAAGLQPDGSILDLSGNDLDLQPHAGGLGREEDVQGGRDALRIGSGGYATSSDPIDLVDKEFTTVIVYRLRGMESVPILRISGSSEEFGDHVHRMVLDVDPRSQTYKVDVASHGAPITPGSHARTSVLPVLNTSGGGQFLVVSSSNASEDPAASLARGKRNKGGSRFWLGQDKLERSNLVASNLLLNFEGHLSVGLWARNEGRGQADVLEILLYEEALDDDRIQEVLIALDAIYDFQTINLLSLLRASSELETSIIGNFVLESQMEGSTTVVAEIRATRFIDALIAAQGLCTSDILYVRGFDSLLEGNGGLTLDTFFALRGLESIVEGIGSLESLIRAERSLDSGLEGTSTVDSALSYAASLVSSLEARGTIVEAGLKIKIVVFFLEAALEGTSSLEVLLGAFKVLEADLAGLGDLDVVVEALRGLATTLVGTSEAEALFYRRRALPSLLEGSSLLDSDIDVGTILRVDPGPLYHYFQNVFSSAGNSNLVLSTLDPVTGERGWSYTITSLGSANARRNVVVDEVGGIYVDYTEDHPFQIGRIARFRKLNGPVGPGAGFVEYSFTDTSFSRTDFRDMYVDSAHVYLVTEGRAATTGGEQASRPVVHKVNRETGSRVWSVIGEPSIGTSFAYVVATPSGVYAATTDTVYRHQQNNGSHSTAGSMPYTPGGTIRGLAADEEDDLYIVQSDTNQLQKRTAFGVSIWTTSLLGGPGALVVGKDHVYVMITGNPGVIRRYARDTGVEDTTGSWPITLPFAAGTANPRLTINPFETLTVTRDFTPTDPVRIVSYDADGNQIWFNEEDYGDGFRSAIGSVPGPIAAFKDEWDAYLVEKFGKPLASSLEGLASSTSLLMLLKGVGTGLEAEGTLSSLLEALRGISSELEGEATLEADITATRLLLASLLGTSQVSSAIVALRYLSSTLDGEATLSSLLEALRGISSELEGRGSVETYMTLTKGLGASLIGSGSSDIDITKLVPLASGPEATASLDVEIDVAETGPFTDGFSDGYFFGELLIKKTLVGTSSLTASLELVEGMPIPADNLVAWYDADQLEGYSNNDTISSWETVSGDSDFTLHAITASGHNLPRYRTNEIGSKPAIFFDSQDTSNRCGMRTTVTGAFPLDNTPYTIFKVLNSGRFGDAERGPFVRAVNTSDSFSSWVEYGLSIIGNGDKFRLHGASGTPTYPFTNTERNNPLYTTVVVRGATDWEVRANGTVKSCSTDCSPSNMMLNDDIRLAINAFSDTLGYQIADVLELAELIIYDRALTTQEIEDVETYLADKYNL